MSECDADCKLCSPLACLRPQRITFPEFLRELDQAAQACATTVVFPPNFLNHPEASQFCFETSRRGLTPLVRIRPTQLVSMSELLSTLVYRRAKFEVIVAEAIPTKALGSRLDFKTVLMPSTLIEPSILFDSIPFSWRVGMEVVAPLAQNFEHALSADEVFLFASERKLRPYSEHQRATMGKIPGAVAKLERITGQSDDIRMSVVIAAHQDSDLRKTLEALDTQSMEKKFFEVIVVCDRVSDEFIESVRAYTNLQLFRQPECWGEIAFRQAEAFNLAATHARGSQLLFLSEGFAVERDLLTRCAQLSEPFVKIDSRSDDAPTRCALLMSLKHFFKFGGFATTDHTGFEFELFETKAPAIPWVIGDLDKADVPATSPKYSSMRALAAQDMFLTTLNKEFYQKNYALMGARPWLRRTFWLVSKIGVFQKLQSVFARSRAKAMHLRTVKA